AELARVPGAEGAVAAQRLSVRLAPVEDRAQLATACQPEVQRRADALGGDGQALAGRVPDEEDAVLNGRAQLMGDPVALVTHRRQPQLAREPHGRLLDAMRGPEGPHAYAQLIARGKVPAVAGAHVARVDPQLHLPA